ncbi:unnamed protein product, partial [Iphiclides podalirius]
MCLHVRLLCGALWWPLLTRCARAARTYDDGYDQVCPLGPLLVPRLQPTCASSSFTPPPFWQHPTGKRPRALPFLLAALLYAVLFGCRL